MSGTTRPDFNTIQSWNRLDSTYQCFVQELLLCQNSEKALTIVLGRAGAPPAVRPPKYRVALKRSIYVAVWDYISSQRSKGATFEAIANSLAAGTGLPYKTDMISQCYQMWSSHNPITNLNAIVTLFSPPSSPPSVPTSVQQTPTGGNEAGFLQPINSSARSMGLMGGQDQLDMSKSPDLGFSRGPGHPYQGPNWPTPNPNLQPQPQPAPLPHAHYNSFGNPSQNQMFNHLGQLFDLPIQSTPMQMPFHHLPFNPATPQHVQIAPLHLLLTADMLLDEYTPPDNARMPFQGPTNQAQFHGTFMQRRRRG
ncbi:hypothetical protein K505DRAFT_333730 [Melanomma pulvis-pyrius CBS 109.77]|uniref:Uncharacterized protein n=1 Tax=Melanomma pulvis-pyrius CBS 109.77 TaxID=1314802 RepID=A0A6A6XP27_9PLEO|nr:hypothetical protein K505DRAFT_333730 [Melanomma pulvis-pyrius CBS 109.77]